MQTIITQNFQATRKLGRELAKKIKAGQIICLSGDLGSGKTTMAQGLLKGLGAKGPYTSPTFLIIKNYKKEIPISKSQFPNKSKIQNPKSKTLNIYHIDVYRVNEKDILSLGWEEIIKDKNNIIIIEWAERIKKIIPAGAKWIKFSWEGEKKRKISFYF